jgi:hypothetical protein
VAGEPGTRRPGRAARGDGRCGGLAAAVAAGHAPSRDRDRHGGLAGEQGADFALVTNGAHWIIDEIQLCPESTTTLRQLAAFAKTMGTAEPFGLTCMSATVPEGLLGTVDNPAPGDVVGILPEELPASSSLSGPGARRRRAIGDVTVSSGRRGGRGVLGR